MSDADPDPGEMRPEYDFSDGAGVVVGKYAEAYRRSHPLVRLDDDVAERFADSASVNAALRDYLAIRERPAAG